jgi:transcriptional regulator with XRE-family HTH domain
MYVVDVSDIGVRIRTLREERGETLAALGAAVGLSASAVHQWESGTTKGLRPANLLAVADHYGVAVHWLVNGAGPQRVMQTRTEFEAQALKLFRKLTPDGQHAALSHVNWLLSQERVDDPPSPETPYLSANRHKLNNP